jgi:hypothetical protein
MTDLNVQLRADGLFEIKSPFLGKSSYQIVNNADDPTSRDWNVRSFFDGDMVTFSGGDLVARWKVVNSFENLDEALDWCVSMVTGIYPVPNYIVTLPCGAHFTRPGRIPVENVMAGIGWSYVTHVKGNSVIKFPSTWTSEAVERHYEGLVEETAVVLGSIDICPSMEDEEDGSSSLWSADVMVPIGGFTRISEITEEASRAFAMEGVPVLADFEYFGRPNVKAHSSPVLDFMHHFNARVAEVDAPKAKEA